MSVPETKLTIVRPDGPTETRNFLPGAYVIGRSPESDIYIETPLISRAHARLTINDRECVIEDLGSSNGTFVSGEKITAVTILRLGSQVMLGPVTVQISREGDAVAPVSLVARREALQKLLPPEFLREKKYEIGNTIARGGMGAVLNARELTIQRNVAMKVMLDGNAPDEVMRFVSEAKVTGQLEHPNIVPVHELGVDEKEQVFYTMKYVRGITLRKVLDLLFEGQKSTLEKYPLAQLLTVFQKVCDAIAFAHSKGVIHRDLKPDNFMIGDYGEVLVMDWGLAKVLDPTLNQAAAGYDGKSMIRTGVREELAAVEKQSGNVMGTPQYMAPEQAYGAHDQLDIRTDVYALGAILHHLLTLRPPIEGDDPQEVLRKAAHGEWEPARKTTAGKTRLPHLPGGKVPDALSAVAQKAMANKASDRYQNVPDFQADIEAYQNGFATTAEKAGMGKQALLLFKRQRYLVAGLATAIVLFIVAVSAVFGLRAKDAAAEQEAAALVEKIRASHPGGVVLTKADYEALAILAEKQNRPEAKLYRDLAAAAK
jgi:eukaryotic-like serine/threonine-protein kinase